VDPFAAVCPGDGLDVAEHNEKKGERDGLQQTSGLGGLRVRNGFPATPANGERGSDDSD